MGIEHVPMLPLGIGELRTLGVMLKSYVTYTRQMARSSPLRNEQLQVLEGIRHRLRSALLAVQSGQDVRVPLTRQEFQAIDEALAGFIKMVRHRIPLSQEREETLADIEAMRRAIVHLYS